MATRRKPAVKESVTVEPQEEVKQEVIETIEEKQENILIIPDRLYDRMRAIGNDAYWLRIIELQIESLRNCYP